MGFVGLCWSLNDMQSLCTHYHFWIESGISHNHQCIVYVWVDPRCGVLLFWGVVGYFPLQIVFSSVNWSGAFLLPLDWCLFFLVDITPYEDWTICPFIVSTACGKYLAELVYVNPGNVSKFSFLVALRHVDLSGNPASACIYWTRASILGRS